MIGAGQRGAERPGLGVGAPNAAQGLAVGGELQALDMLDAIDEAAALTGDVAAAFPDVKLPPDILARIGKA